MIKAVVVNCVDKSNMVESLKIFHQMVDTLYITDCRNRNKINYNYQNIKKYNIRKLNILYCC